MNAEDKELLGKFLTDHAVLSLGVLVDGEPYVSMVPFAVQEDRAAVIIHVSRLARHSKGLSDGAAFGALIHQAETEGSDPLQLPRVSLQGKVRVLTAGSPEYDAGKTIYAQKFPQSRQTFALGDFQLLALELTGGRLVAGFARTINLNKDHFRELA